MFDNKTDFSKKITISNRYQRSTNLELLRIFSMLIIVAHHYAMHSEFDLSPSLSFNRLLIDILAVGGKLGVNCFVLITGYFSCKNLDVKVKSFLKLLVHVTIFSLLTNLLALYLEKPEFSVNWLLKLFLPINYPQWWFASTYFVLLLISPFINTALVNLSQKKHKQLIIILFILWCVFYTLRLGEFNGNNLTWFVFLYIVAAYIKMYPNKFYDSKKITGLNVVVWWIVIVLSFIALNYFNYTFPTVFDDFSEYLDFKFLKDTMVFIEASSVPLTLLSISLFCFFKNLNVKYSKSINSVAAAMFSVYLIHDNRSIRKILWVDIFKGNEYQKSNCFIVHAIISIGLVFVLCTVISLLYNTTIKKATDNLIEKLFSKSR